MSDLDANHPTRTKLLNAAIKVIRSQGYSATTVDDICAASSVGKGSFFHHFKSKEALGVAATQHWNTVTGARFETAPYQAVADPRERILAYIDFRAQIVQGELADVTCLLGTMVQETYISHPALRAACREGIEGHARTLVPTIAQAKALYAPQADWNPENLALYTQAALQGAFVLAKAQGDTSIASALIAHLRNYVQGLLTPQASAPRQAKSLATYIDGYVLAVPAANKEAFIAHVQNNVLIFKQYGALSVVDCWSESDPSEKLYSFPSAVQRQDGEAIVFSWIEWPFKAIRDAAWPQILKDPRMQQATLPYDPKRMLRGGFEMIVNAS